MKKGFLIFAILFSMCMISLGIFGFINRENIEEDVKNNENENSNTVNKVNVDELYNYILGFGYHYDYVNDGQFTSNDYYSDVHQDYLVTFDNLSNEAIVRNAIKQISTCGSDNVSSISYDIIGTKAKKIVGRDIILDNLVISMYIGNENGSYVCMNNSCDAVGGMYCSTTPFNDKYTMVSHSIENNNVIIIDQDINFKQYKHTFTKDNNGDYYWVSSQPNY